MYCLNVYTCWVVCVGGVGGVLIMDDNTADAMRYMR